jgi:hypothetical protein
MRYMYVKVAVHHRASVVPDSMCGKSYPMVMGFDVARANGMCSGYVRCEGIHCEGIRCGGIRCGGCVAQVYVARAYTIGWCRIACMGKKENKKVRRNVSVHSHFLLTGMLTRAVWCVLSVRQDCMAWSLGRLNSDMSKCQEPIHSRWTVA